MQHAFSVIHSSYQPSANFGTTPDLYLGRVNGDSTNIIRILFTNYDIIAYFLNLAFCSEHFISLKHRILATFNINKTDKV